MAWQIQCKQHFLKQLYTLNNQLESEETLTWHEDVQMYCWDCMRVRGGVRGAMFCCWICMRVYESCMRFCESCWERFCDMRVVWELCEMVKIFSKYRPWPDKTWTWPTLMGKQTWPGQTDLVTTFKNRVSETWFHF